MSRSFTLIELIFVIVIIGLLASVAVPKFAQTKASASANSAKSVVSSIRTAIETKHGEWIIDDDLGSSDGCTPQGYPQKLDSASLNSAGEDLFKGTSTLPLLKTAIKSCLGNDCWVKYAEDSDTNVSKYKYKFSDDDFITIEYNGSSGTFDCIDDGGMSKSDCESIID